MSRHYNIAWKQNTYDGVMYRSLLETKWHIFLKELGVIHSYEPKTFYFNEYQDIERRIFTIDYGLMLCPYHYVEIKPTPPTQVEALKCKLLSERGFSVAMFAGPCSPKVKVLRWQNGTRLRFRKGVKFYAQCFLAGISPEMGETIAGLKAVLGERQNWLKAFEMAYKYKV